MALTVDSALKLLQATLNVGREQGFPVATVIVDAGGRVLVSGRSEAAGFIHLAAAERKAVASVNFKAPTHGVLEMIKADPLLLSAVSSTSDISVLPGGFPLVRGGAVIGALGIAGGHYSQDQAAGEKALAALGTLT